MDRPPVIGWSWDTAKGKLVELPVVKPSEIVYARAHPEAIAETTFQSTTLRVYGLSPMLVVVPMFYMRLRINKDPSDGPFPPSQMRGELHAFPLAETSHPLVPIVEGWEIPAEEVFYHGGSIAFDGAEFSSGMQAFEVVVTAKLMGPCDHDLVGTLQVKQKDPLGCLALADKLAENIRVEIGPTLVFT